MRKIFSSLQKKSENAGPFSLSVRKCTSEEKNFFLWRASKQRSSQKVLQRSKRESRNTVCYLELLHAVSEHDICLVIAKTVLTRSMRPVRTLIMFLLGRRCNWNQKSNNKPEGLDQQQLKILALLRTS